MTVPRELLFLSVIPRISIRREIPANAADLFPPVLIHIKPKFPDAEWLDYKVHCYAVLCAWKQYKFDSCTVLFTPGYNFHLSLSFVHNGAKNLYANDAVVWNNRCKSLKQ